MRKALQKRFERLEMDISDFRVRLINIDRPQKYEDKSIIGDVVILYRIGYNSYKVSDKNGIIKILSEYQLDCIKKLTEDKK